MERDTGLVVRAICIPDGDGWSAQCVEYDIGAQGSTVDQAYGRFLGTLQCELDESMHRHGEPFRGIPRAPSAFEELWERRAESFTSTSAPRLKADGSEVGVTLALAAQRMAAHPFGKAPTLAEYMAWAEQQGCTCRSCVSGTNGRFVSYTRIEIGDRWVAIADTPQDECLLPRQVAHLDRRLGLDSPFPKLRADQHRLGWDVVFHYRRQKAPQSRQDA